MARTNEELQKAILDARDRHNIAERDLQEATAEYVKLHGLKSHLGNSWGMWDVVNHVVNERARKSFSGPEQREVTRHTVERPVPRK